MTMNSKATVPIHPRDKLAKPVPYAPNKDVLYAQTKDVLSLLIALRFANALCVHTFFQPDEYFQSLEPAWNIAFGSDSEAWLTWEWQHQLRSSLHPVLFAGVYLVADYAAGILSLVPPLRAVFLAAVPSVFQGVLSAIGDFYTWRLAGKIFGRTSTVAWTALWLTVLNPWQWFCSTRTFSNSLETTLTVVAIYYWPWHLFGERKEGQTNALPSVLGLRISLLFAALAVVLRPTNLLIWSSILTLAVTRMTLDGKSPINKETLTVLVREIVLCGILVLGISAVSDYLYFGGLTFPPYKWLYFNISQSLAVFYGRNPWHYYLSQGIPLLTTTSLPWAVTGLVQAALGHPEGSVELKNTLKTLSFCVITTIAALSTISHKEVRFIYPLLPILNVLAAPRVASYFTQASPAAATPASEENTTLRRKLLIVVIVLLNILLAGFLSVAHQPAPLSVVDFIRTEYERIYWDHLGIHPDILRNSHSTLATAQLAEGADGDELFALFLMPCHSTPWRSRLVYPGLRARALTCEPPLHTQPGTSERAAYLDEADRFYAAAGPGPADFLATEIWPLLTSGEDEGVHKRGGELPRYIVGFEGVEDALQAFFDPAGKGPGKDMGFKLHRVWEGWNGFFNEDWRRQGSIVVWDTGVYPDMKINKSGAEEA